MATETFTLTLDDTPSESVSVTINDTSQTPASFNPDYTISVTASGGRYFLSGSDATGSVSGAQPALTFYPGNKVRFSVNAPGHPFYVKTTNTQGTANGANGVVGNGTNTVDWTVPNDTTSTTYYYVCSVHSGMGNTIRNRVWHKLEEVVSGDLVKDILNPMPSGINLPTGVRYDDEVIGFAASSAAGAQFTIDMPRTGWTADVVWKQRQITETGWLFVLTNGTGSGSNSDGVGLKIVNSRLNLHHNSSTAQWISTSGNLGLDKWYHAQVCAYVTNSNQLRIWTYLYDLDSGTSLGNVVQDTNFDTSPSDANYLTLGHDVTVHMHQFRIRTQTIITDPGGDDPDLSESDKTINDKIMIVPVPPTYG